MGSPIRLSTSQTGNRNNKVSHKMDDHICKNYFSDSQVYESQVRTYYGAEHGNEAWQIIQQLNKHLEEDIGDPDSERETRDLLSQLSWLESDSPGELPEIDHIDDQKYLALYGNNTELAKKITYSYLVTCDLPEPINGNAPISSKIKLMLLRILQIIHQVSNDDLNELQPDARIWFSEYERSISSEI